MWQFREAVDGMSEACVALGLPVVGGNVSFYNESRGQDIDPTPVVGVVGVIDDLTSAPPAPRLQPGDAIVLLGATHAELGGSEWATALGLRTGAPPASDLDAALALHELVRTLVHDRVVNGVHDCADGGLAVTLAEMAIEGGCGARVALDTALAPGLAWFSESASRVLLSVAPGRLAHVLAAASAVGVPAAHLGDAGGDRLVAEFAFDVAVADAAAVWREGLPRALGMPADAG
jgi:phosphoribosylformylglycinamidine synthase